nr:hypothetical protein [Bradyrhizobium neotropicale]
MKRFEVEVCAGGMTVNCPYRSRRWRRCADRCFDLQGQEWNTADAIGTDDWHRPAAKGAGLPRRGRHDVFFSGNDPRYLAHRRELGDSAMCVVEAISGALHELAAKATNS